MDRRDKHNYYLDIAETVLERGTCIRRNYGSIIVKNLGAKHNGGDNGIVENINLIVFIVL